MENNNLNLDTYYKFNDIFRQENELGAVLSAAAFLEDSLEKIITTFLAETSSTKELLNGFSAPLGTLGAKSKLSYSLGLIDSDIFVFIETIRKIRNEFAHNWTGVNLSSPKINSLIDNCPCHPLLKLIIKNSSKVLDQREWFNNNVSYFLLELSIIPDLIKKEKRIPHRIVRFGKPYPSKEEAEKAGIKGEDILE